ncbi:MAG TPA: RNA polymerase sigma factor RpoD/SigA [Thermoleophilia bacterium]|nr:RNA polymerase sigma factor RpoD/SigA [Thermoleophilia bacterium]
MPERKSLPRKPAAAPKAGEGRGREAARDSLNAYIREIARFKPLSPDDEKVLGRRIQQGDQKALNSLVEANLRFVVSYAKRFRGMGLAFLDLIHEGNLGLIEAAKRFDPTRNVKFISYAVWWVRQAIFHALSEHARAFRLPQKVSGQLSKVENARDRLSVELERAPTSEELAKEADLTEAEVEDLLRVAGGDVSLSQALSEDGTLELGDTLEQDSIAPVELDLIRSSFVRQIQAMVEGLDEKEREVLRMRFGLDGEEPRTLQEIGDNLGLSRERIRQIESKAKEKLRRNQQAQSLRGYLN